MLCILIVTPSAYANPHRLKACDNLVLMYRFGSRSKQVCSWRLSIISDPWAGGDLWAIDLITLADSSVIDRWILPSAAIARSTSGVTSRGAGCGCFQRQFGSGTTPPHFTRCLANRQLSTASQSLREQTLCIFPIRYESTRKFTPLVMAPFSARVALSCHSHDSRRRVGLVISDPVIRC